jgi:hypothetical protein
LPDVSLADTVNDANGTFNTTPVRLPSDKSTGAATHHVPFAPESNRSTSYIAGPGCAGNVTEKLPSLAVVAFAQDPSPGCVICTKTPDSGFPASSSTTPENTGRFSASVTVTTPSAGTVVALTELLSE